MPTSSPFSIIKSRVHLLVVGRTGAGKSTLVRALCASEIAARRGLVLVDPHGDLSEEVRALVPSRMRDALVWFDPTDASCLGLNPFARVPPGERALVVANLLAAFRKLFGDGWGPRTEHLLRGAFRALLEVRGATFDDAGRMLFDERHRAWVLRQVKDDATRRFWLEELPSYSKQLFGDAISAPLNKLGAMMGDERVRAVVTRSRPRLDIARAMERDRVVLARLPKGMLGDGNVTVLAGVLMGALQAATMRRATVPLADRRPFTLLIDELSCVPSEVPLELMGEGRKFGLRVVVCTQSVSALPHDVRSALFANAGLVVFRVSGQDGELLAPELANEYGPGALTSLGTGEAVVRLGPEKPRLVQFAGP